MDEDLLQLKIFVNIDDFSCVIFWAQAGTIPPEQHVSIPSDKNVLTLAVSKMYNENIGAFRHRKLCMKI